MIWRKVPFVLTFVWIVLGCPAGAFAADVLELPRTGQITCYDPAGNTADCGSTGQDGEIQAGAVWPEPRYMDNEDGTVTDLLTGLMWLKDGDCFGSLTWQSAMKAAAGFNLNPGEYDCNNYKAGYKDWIVPDLNELYSLFNAEEAGLADWFNGQGFVRVQAAGYWSSTSGANSYDAWTCNLNNQFVRPHAKITHNHLWLVRASASGPVKIWKTGQTKKYFAGDDGALQRGAPWSMSRFKDNGDGTVTDGMTGLMWLKDAGCLGEKSWQSGLDAIGSLNARNPGPACAGYTAAYADWRLPNTIELRSLIDYSRDYPALARNNLFNNVLADYWTSTTSALAPGNAFVLEMARGEIKDGVKSKARNVWPVRSVVPVSTQAKRSNPEKSYLLLPFSGTLGKINWPEPRFKDNGDGTLTDNMTGIMWLKDANCFGKMDWAKAFKVLKPFAVNSRKFKCADYNAGYSDWVIPYIETFAGLVNGGEEDKTAWLKGQGFVNVQPSGYWSATPAEFNIYYANVLSMKNGGVRNYSKMLQFNVWLARPAEMPTVEIEPRPLIRANGSSRKLFLYPGERLSLNVSLNTNGLARPADFWVWYDTPAGPLWLSGDRQWQTETAPVYSGHLFNMTDDLIFVAKTSRLPEAKYTFHFAVDLNQNAVFEKSGFEDKVEVIVGGDQDVSK